MKNGNDPLDPGNLPLPLPGIRTVAPQRTATRAPTARIDFLLTNLTTIKALLAKIRDLEDENERIVESLRVIDAATPPAPRLASSSPSGRGFVCVDCKTSCVAPCRSGPKPKRCPRCLDLRDKAWHHNRNVRAAEKRGKPPTPPPLDPETMLGPKDLEKRWSLGPEGVRLRILKHARDVHEVPGRHGPSRSITVAEADRIAAVVADLLKARQVKAAKAHAEWNAARKATRPAVQDATAEPVFHPETDTPPQTAPVLAPPIPTAVAVNTAREAVSPPQPSMSPEAGSLTPMEIVERMHVLLADVAIARERGVLVVIDPTARPVRFTAESIRAFRLWMRASRASRQGVAPEQEWTEPRLDLREIGISTRGDR